MSVIILGTGDLARQLYFYLEQIKANKVQYFCVNREFYSEKELFGKNVIIFEEIGNYINPIDFQFVIGIGYKKLRMRQKAFDMIKKAGYNLVNFVHPTALILGEIKGEGNIIFPNVIVEPFAEINNNNIIWTNTLLCHDCMVGNHNFISASNVIGGFTKIGDNNFIGLNTVIKDHIIIEKEVLVGAKSLINKNPDNYSVYYGIPAQKIREHFETGIEIN